MSIKKNPDPAAPLFLTENIKMDRIPTTTNHYQMKNLYIYIVFQVFEGNSYKTLFCFLLFSFYISRYIYIILSFSELPSSISEKKESCPEEFYLTEQWPVSLRHWIPNLGVMWSKPQGSSKVDSTFHFSEGNKLSIRHFWEFSGKKYTVSSKWL